MAHSLIVKQHTVNPLIAPDVNPFLPHAIMLFISTDHCIGVTGMSMTPSQFPPSVRMPAAVPL
ncbi:unnamed protein product [Staurois parvus]|uniref:Uncharacterized protein n=1 Tax=Staurois parvus TaxID=386267 RepID=A0ABN9FYX6_9NEOB|nr:unnamed protein product [Staurois parvus]